MSAPTLIGFVGLGQMGQTMATNTTQKSGIEVMVYDKAGTAERAPEGAKLANSLGDVLSSCDTVFLSVPDGPVSIALANEIASYEGRKSNVVIDLSTIGPEAAREADEILKAAGVTYIDAPVSGGQAGAAAGTITLMCGGPKVVLDEHMGVFESFTGNVVHCGETAGQGQAVKILNNYLSAVAFAASSEAITYGMSQGVEMKTILDAVNVSTGRNTATMDKFPNRILTGTYDCGFATKLQSKDMNVFVKEAKAAGTPLTVATTVAALWNGCDALKPGSDISRIYDYIREKC